MRQIKILHEIIRGMDEYLSTGVPEIYWNLAKELTRKLYGEKGLSLIESHHKEYDSSVDIHPFIVHSFNCNPEELINKLKQL
jgi:hypothetical protein